MVKKKKKDRKQKFDWISARSGSDPGLRTIEIDIDVHRTIEAARISFDETDSDILRRLIDTDAGKSPETPSQTDAMAPPASAGRRAKGGGAVEGGWSKIGRHGRTVLLPDGTKLRAAYGGQTIQGEIRGGMWSVGEQTFNSPSAALNAFARTRDGNAVNLNGWRHWEALLPDAETWVGIGDL